MLPDDGMGPLVADQGEVRCVLMRGGTSKALFFRAQDLPPAGPGRDELLLRIMGSPDVLQIDGLGGSRPITSKVAIVGPSERVGADVDYTFAQVSIDRAQVSYHGNCGNISSGVGPFAIDERMLEAADGRRDVRIWNTNTGRLIIASVLVRDGKAAVTGDYAIPGVPGTGAEIRMDWSRSVGAKTGRLLPTGQTVDTVALQSGSTVRVTVCDAGNPVLWIPAEDIGLTGSERPEDINDNGAVLDVMRELRGRIAAAIGMCSDWRLIDDESPDIPMLGVVAAPDGYRTLNGDSVLAADMDLRVRLMFMNRLHESIAGTGAISLAAASRVKGSVIGWAASAHDQGTVRIGHPSGVTPVRVRARPSDVENGGVSYDEISISRTARRLMQGSALYPSPDPRQK
jgi:hypothetical protein